MIDGQQLDSPGLIMKFESNPALLPPTVDSPPDLPPAQQPPKQLEILVVDDSRLNRKMLIKCLRADNHECSECEDGLEAVAAVKERINHANGGKGKPYDVILMDFVMPNMDGPTATREIRALGYTSLIFGVTGNGTHVSFLSLLTSRCNCTDAACPLADSLPLLKYFIYLTLLYLVFDIMSGLPADVAHFLSCGADKILLKPLDILAFGQAMRDATHTGGT